MASNISKNLEEEVTTVSSHFFVQLENPDSLFPILVSRLPFSAHIYNNVKLYQKWMDVFTFWTLDGRVTHDSWIVLVMSHKAVGQEVSISRPPDSKIMPAIAEAFSSHPAIDWTENHGFFGVDPDVSAMLVEIDLRAKGNAVSVHPSLIYYMDPQEAVSFDKQCFQLENKKIQIKTLDSKEGREFITSTWKYAPVGAEAGMVPYIDRNLSRNPSFGVYVDGTLVAGVVQACYGRIGMLHTLTQHRGQGYAQLCTQTLIKIIMEEWGLIPNCLVEMWNEASKAFQTKVGLRAVGQTDYILFAKPQNH